MPVNTSGAYGSGGGATMDGAAPGAAEDGSASEAARAQRVLRDRARRLAQAPADVASGARIAFLIFRLRDERYAIEPRQLQSVQPSVGLTPVPCTPPYVAGILNVRGEVITVLDLANALQLPGPAAGPERGQVLLVDLPQVKVGLLVDEVLGTQDFDLERLDRSLSGRDFARGVADARTTFLDLQQLLTDSRFTVVEEVT